MEFSLVITGHFAYAFSFYWWPLIMLLVPTKLLKFEKNHLYEVYEFLLAIYDRCLEVDALRMLDITE